MAIVRIEALRGLEHAITTAVPDLRGNVCIGQADAGQDLAFPSLSIDPIRFKYHPDQALEVYEPAPDRVVVNVGRHEGTVQLRLGAKTPYARYELEQQVLNVFLGTPGHPGVLLTTISECSALGDFLAAWEYEEDEWEDGKAFDQQFYSIMAVTAQIPALVTYEGVYTIDQLQLGLTGEMTKLFTSATFSTDQSVEVVQVNQDGSFTVVS